VGERGCRYLPRGNSNVLSWFPSTHRGKGRKEGLPEGVEKRRRGTTLERERRKEGGRLRGGKKKRLLGRETLAQGRALVFASKGKRSSVLRKRSRGGETRGNLQKGEDIMRSKESLGARLVRAVWLSEFRGRSRKRILTGKFSVRRGGVSVEEERVKGERKRFPSKERGRT